MSSLFDVGKSAVQSYRQALAVTGQNIANINTEGYKRRAADLEEVGGSQGGITSIANQAGLGVRVADIRRAFDGFLLARANTTNSNFQKVNVFLIICSNLKIRCCRLRVVWVIKSVGFLGSFRCCCCADRSSLKGSRHRSWQVFSRIIQRTCPSA